MHGRDFTASQVAECDNDWGAAGGLVLTILFVGGFFGAVMGFFFSGRIVLAAGVLGALLAGLVLGWLLHGGTK
jgi:hypothetical protein